MQTAGGVLAAERLVIGTNGYADGLVDPLRRSIVPVRSVQVTTRPLSDKLEKSILPERQVVSDTRKLLLYFRLDAQGRFIMGGRGRWASVGSWPARAISGQPSSGCSRSWVASSGRITGAATSH